MIKVITNDNCPVCDIVKEAFSNAENIEYIDINSSEAKQYNVKEVPIVIFNNKKYRINGINKRGDFIFDEID